MNLDLQVAKMDEELEPEEVSNGPKKKKKVHSAVAEWPDCPEDQRADSYYFWQELFVTQAMRKTVKPASEVVKPLKDIAESPPKSPGAKSPAKSPTKTPGAKSPPKSPAKEGEEMPTTSGVSKLMRRASRLAAAVGRKRESLSLADRMGLLSRILSPDELGTTPRQVVPEPKPVEETNEEQEAEKPPEDAAPSKTGRRKSKKVRPATAPNKRKASKADKSASAKEEKAGTKDAKVDEATKKPRPESAPVERTKRLPVIRYSSDSYDEFGRHEAELRAMPTPPIVHFREKQGRRKGFNNEILECVDNAKKNEPFNQTVTMIGTLVVTLEASAPWACVRYTLDCSTPSFDSLVYTRPLEISKDTTLRAVCCKRGFMSGEIALYTTHKPDIAGFKERLWQSPERLKAQGAAAAMASTATDSALDALLNANIEESPLHAAARSTDVIQLRQLLKDSDVDLEKSNQDGLRPLHLACSAPESGDSVIVVQTLLDRGADAGAEATEAAKCITPLHCAVTSGAMSAIKLLIDRKADVDAGQASDLTPLHAATIALNAQSPALIDLLIQSGANVNAVDKNNCSALHHACMMIANKRSSKETLSAGECDARNEMVSEVVKTLLKHSPKLDGKNKRGMRAADLACMKQNFDVANLINEVGGFPLVGPGPRK